MKDKIKIIFVRIKTSAKKTTTKIIAVIYIGSAVFALTSSKAMAIGLSIPKHEEPIEVIIPSNRFNYDVGNPVSVSKVLSRIISQANSESVFKRNSENLILLYATDPLISSNKEILRIVKKLKGGGDNIIGIIGTAVFLGIIILLFSIPTEQAFLPGPERDALFLPGRGPGFKYPTFLPQPDHNYRSRTMCPVFEQGSQKSNREELTQLSASSQTQIQQFIVDGEVNLISGYQEIQRRATSLGCEMKYTYQEFKALCTESGRIIAKGVREAISVIQGEMEGFYDNPRRVDLGKGVAGLDFEVTGRPPYEHITHIDVSNPVGSEIQKADGQLPDVTGQCESIGRKKGQQAEFWSSQTQEDLEQFFPNVRLDAASLLPKSSDNVLIMADLFDVPGSEKEIAMNGINNGLNGKTVVVFINNSKNV